MHGTANKRNNFHSRVWILHRTKLSPVPKRKTRLLDYHILVVYIQVEQAINDTLKVDVLASV